LPCPGGPGGVDAVNVVLAHRLISRQLSGQEPLLPLAEMLHEVRANVLTPAMDGIGANNENNAFTR